MTAYRLQLLAPSGAVYEPQARKMLEVLEAQRVMLRLESPAGLLKVTEINGFRISVFACGDGLSYIRIEGGSGFVGRPAGPIDFDLTDDTTGVVYTFDAEAASQFDANYGNIYDPGTDVSWKGPAGVLIPYDPKVDYPKAVTREDGFGIGLSDYYTPFSSKIYSGGSALFTIPADAQPKVLCYGVVGGKQRVLLNKDYVGLANPDGATGGFYEELMEWRGSEWVRIGYRRASRADLPCVFLGNLGVLTQAGIYGVDGSFTEFMRKASDRSADGTNWHRSGKVEDKIFYSGTSEGYDGVATSFMINDDTTYSKTGGSTTLQADIYIPPYTITVSGPFDIVAGSQYTQSGGLGGGTWSISSGSIDSTTGVVTNPGCGTVTVTYTETICGTVAGSKVCKSASGHFVNGGLSAEIMWPRLVCTDSAGCSGCTYYTSDPPGGPRSTNPGFNINAVTSYYSLTGTENCRSTCGGASMPAGYHNFICDGWVLNTWECLP